MTRKLPIIFAMTAFAGVAVAEYPKMIVHEHSLAYNYPGSEYELIPHAVPASDEKDASVMSKHEKVVGDEAEKARENPSKYGYDSRKSKY